MNRGSREAATREPSAVYCTLLERRPFCLRAAFPRPVCFLLFICPAAFLAADVNEQLRKQMTTVIILTLFPYFQVVWTGLDNGDMC